MVTEVAVSIDAPRSRVWEVVTDVENTPNTISGVDEIEILERPADGLRGLKWLEKRTIFGKTASETMWISDAEAPSFYTTEARSHGSIYRTVIRLAEEGRGTRLSMQFESTAESGMAKVMAILFGPLMKRTIAKALLKDLQDVKKAVEAGLV